MGAFVLPFEPARGRRAWATVALFLPGSAAALLFVESAAGPVPWLLLAAVATGLYAVARAPARSRAARVARALARAAVVALHGIWIYEAALCASMLAWTVPWWAWALVALLALGAVAGLARRALAVAVPAVLPLGAFCAACLMGWAREEWRVRCDDVAAVTAQPSARIVVPVREDLDRCGPGDWLPIGYYPRKVWPAPDGARFVFTTQRAIHDVFRPAAPLPSRVAGLVCESEARVDPSVPAPAVSCLLDHGKAHAIAEDPDNDRLLVGILGGLDGRTGGIVAVSRTSPLRELGRAVLPEGGSFYVDAASDRIGAFGDEGRVVDVLRASDLAVLERDVPASFLGPDFVRYDPERHEGVACSASGPLRTLDGQAALAIGFRGVPFSARPLAPSTRYPSSWLALSWGCDWTPDRDRVFVAVSTLGQIVSIDRRSGDVTGRSYVGLGVRPLTYDPRRGVAYVGRFLSGEVLAVDVATGAIARRWFAGRFVRDIELVPGGAAIVVTSNVGIVRIALD